MIESYMQKLYRTNPTYREKQKKRMKQYGRDHQVEKNEKYRELYSNRTIQQIEKTKAYLKKLKSTQSYKDRENKRAKKAYANRSSQQIKDRKEYLKKLRDTT